MSEDIDRTVAVLSRTNAFPGLTDDRLRAVASVCAWHSVQGGTVLFAQGDPSDAIYIVASGILGVYRRDAGGREVTLDRIAAGGIVGEMGVITGETRSATVKSLRACELLRISKADLEALGATLPAVLLAICATLVRRMRAAQERTRTLFEPRTFCILPHDAAVDVNAFARAMVQQIGTHGDAILLTRTAGEGQPLSWFNDLEETYRYVLYEADAREPGWTRLCLRQADCIVLIVDGAAGPGYCAALGPEHRDLPRDIPFDLAILWSNGGKPGNTRHWLDLAQPRRHYHVRTATDAARAARLTIGRGLGLALSGGGARGVAHLGVMRALREHGIAVDAVCGASTGAISAAALATEHDDAAALQEYIAAFVRRIPFSDLRLSRVALLSGGPLRRTLERWFGDTQIEDTPIPYACVSTNLSAGTVSVHRRGRLSFWLQASTAVPGVFPPVVDGGAIYVDGGVLNNLPVNLMEEMGAGAVIGVDVGSEARGFSRGGADETSSSILQRMPNAMELLWRAGTITSEATAILARQSCDILLRPQVDAIGLLGWRAYQQAFAAGYEAALARIPKIKALANLPDAMSPAGVVE